VLDAKTPAGVRRVDIHDNLQEALAAYKAARGETWEPGEPTFLDARGKRWTRNAIAQHVIPPALEEANLQRARAGLPAIRDDVTPHTLRYTCIASLFAAGAAQEYVAARSSTKTSRRPTASTAMCCSGASWGVSEVLCRHRSKGASCLQPEKLIL
jgi:integrase